MTLFIYLFIYLFLNAYFFKIILVQSKKRERGGREIDLWLRQGVYGYIRGKGLVLSYINKYGSIHNFTF